MLATYISNNIQRSNIVKRLVSVKFENQHYSTSDNNRCHIKNERIKRLKEIVWMDHIDHKQEILKNNTLKEAHIYCLLHNLNHSQYGNLIEHFIIEKYNFSKNTHHQHIGDCSKYNENYEIKTSISGIKNNRFNYVHIRLSQMITYYILVAYYLDKSNIEKEGEIFIFKIPKYDIYDIINNYGGYANGTIKNNGKIEIENIMCNCNTYEYAIRPKIGDKCWENLMRFRIDENKL